MHGSAGTCPSSLGYHHTACPHADVCLPDCLPDCPPARCRGLAQGQGGVGFDGQSVRRHAARRHRPHRHQVRTARPPVQGLHSGEHGAGRRRCAGAPLNTVRSALRLPSCPQAHQGGADRGPRRAVAHVRPLQHPVVQGHRDVLAGRHPGAVQAARPAARWVGWGLWARAAARRWGAAGSVPAC